MKRPWGSLLLIGVLLVTSSVTVFAGVPRDMPPLDDPELANFLRSMFNHLNTLQCLGANPDGSVLGDHGELKCAAYDGNQYLCMNTGGGPQKTKSWTCLNVAGVLTGTCDPGTTVSGVDASGNLICTAPVIQGTCGSFDVDANSGPTQHIASGDTLHVLGSAGITTTTSDTGIVTITGGVCGSDTWIQFNDAGACGAVANFTFTKSSDLVTINNAVNGDYIGLRLLNTQAPVVLTTTTTAQMEFGFGSEVDNALIVAGKLGDYTTGANSDSKLEVWTDRNATLTRAVLIGSGDNLSNTGVMSINKTSNSGVPQNTLDVEGGVAVGATAVQHAAPTDGMLIDGQVRIGSTTTSPFSADLEVSDTGLGSGIAAIGLNGPSTSNSPTRINFYRGGVQLAEWDTEKVNNFPTHNRFFALDTADNTPNWFEFSHAILTAAHPMSQEDPVLVIGEMTDAGGFTPPVVAVASGTTITNMRNAIFLAPTINGVAGGPVEAVTNAATVYINAAPSGSNITITNPYALWIDDGAVRFDGAVTYNSTIAYNSGTAITSGTSAIYANIYTPTLTNVANLDASTAYTCQYAQVFTTVTGSCRVDVDPTLTATSTQLGISLPVASNLVGAQDAAGSCMASGIAGQGAAILADTVNDRLQMQWVSADITNQPMYCSWSYRVN